MEETNSSPILSPELRASGKSLAAGHWQKLSPTRPVPPPAESPTSAQPQSPRSGPQVMEYEVRPHSLPVTGLSAESGQESRWRA